MKRFFSAIANVFRAIFSPAGQAKIASVLSTVESAIQFVMPVVQAIAAATPNKTDDEIVAVIKLYAVPVSVPAGPLTDSDKAALLLKTAATAARKEVKQVVGLPDSVVDLVCQLAYTAYKAASKA